jgi:hypothetical protein
MPEMPPRLELPEVDPEDLRNYGRLMRGLQLPSPYAIGLKTNFKSNQHSLHIRWSILELMNRRKVLDAWLHDGELEDFVLQVMAKYPLDPAPSPDNPPPDGKGRMIPAGDILEKIKSAAPG